MDGLAVTKTALASCAVDALFAATVGDCGGIVEVLSAVSRLSKLAETGSQERLDMTEQSKRFERRRRQVKNNKLVRLDR
jgi:hypothetical protein